MYQSPSVNYSNSIYRTPFLCSRSRYDISKPTRMLSTPLAVTKIRHQLAALGRLNRCASVLNTQSSKLHLFSSSNSNQAYFSVSASQKDSISSVKVDVSKVTSSIAECAMGVLVCFRIDDTIFHPAVRQ